MSANFNLIGCAGNIEDLVRGRLEETKSGSHALVCIVSETWTEWLTSDFMKELVAGMDQSLAKGLAIYKDKGEPIKANMLASLAKEAGSWACLTWRVSRLDTFLTEESSTNFSLIYLSSLPLFDAKSVNSNLDQFKSAVTTTTRRRLKCLVGATSATLVFQPRTMPSVFSSIISAGRINRSFFTYKPSSASKLLAWKYRTQLSTLENITTAFSSGDLPTLNLNRLSMENERLKELAAQTSQSFAHEHIASSLYGSHFEKYCVGRTKPEELKPIRLPPRPKSRDCNARVVKYKGRVLRPSTNYKKHRSSSKALA